MSKVSSETLIELAGAGHEWRGPEYFWDAGLRDDTPHYVLQLTLAGQGFYASVHGRLDLPPGTAFFDRIPGPFSYGHAPGGMGVYEQVFVSFRGAMAFRIASQIVASFGHVLHFDPSSPLVAQLIGVAHAVGSGTLTDPYQRSARLYDILMTVQSELTASRVATSRRVTRAMDLIRQNAGDPRFNIDRLAGMIECSREHLAREFRAAAGVSPSEHLTTTRIRLAARALREHPDKLDVIARRCGFSGANYFCRAFGQHTGVTPTQFRERTWMTVP
jgi:AraC-like DNA-binding protein